MLLKLINQSTEHRSLFRFLILKFKILDCMDLFWSNFLSSSKTYHFRNSLNLASFKGRFAIFITQNFSTWNHLTLCRKSSSSFENFIYKNCSQIIHIFNMYKDDLALKKIYNDWYAIKSNQPIRANTLGKGTNPLILPATG